MWNGQSMLSIWQLFSSKYYCFVFYSEFPCTMEQLLERQWEHGSQFLMQQGHHFDSRFIVMLELLLGVRVMVFNTTFNTISVISWQAVLLVKETGVPSENHQPVASH